MWYSVNNWWREQQSITLRTVINVLIIQAYVKFLGVTIRGVSKQLWFI